MQISEIDLQLYSVSSWPVEASPWVFGVSPALSTTQDVGWGWGAQAAQSVSKKIALPGN